MKQKVSVSEEIKFKSCFQQPWLKIEEKEKINENGKMTSEMQTNSHQRVWIIVTLTTTLDA